MTNPYTELFIDHNKNIRFYLYLTYYRTGALQKEIHINHITKIFLNAFVFRTVVGRGAYV